MEEEEAEDVSETLRGVGAAGNGVYSFFLVALTFLRLTFFGLNCGKNRSQFSFLSAGSLASSRLIINV